MARLLWTMRSAEEQAELWCIICLTWQESAEITLGGIFLSIHFHYLTNMSDAIQWPSLPRCHFKLLCLVKDNLTAVSRWSVTRVSPSEDYMKLTQGCKCEICTLHKIRRKYAGTMTGNLLENKGLLLFWRDWFYVYWTQQRSSFLY